MSVMYASHKYIVTSLTKQCAKFLEENLSADTAAVLLEQCNLYNEKDLKTKVLQKIEEEAPAVLSSEDFIKLSKEALHEVLQLKLRISKEVEAFDAAIRWAKNKCQQLFFDKRTIDRFVFHEMRMRSTRFQIISPSRTRFRTGQKYFSYR